MENQEPLTTTLPDTPPEKELEKSVGPIIGIIIILIIVIIGGWLIYARSLQNTIQPISPPGQAIDQRIPGNDLN